MFNIRIPIVTKNLLIINVLAFIISLFIGNGHMLNELLGLHFFLADNFHFYQFVSYMFMHAGIGHLFFNMFALWMFGSVVENTWGGSKFLVYYMICGIGAGLFQEAAQFAEMYLVCSDQGFSIWRIPASYFNGLNTVGASGAVYGILLAFGMLYPNERIFIFPIPIPIKAKWLVIFYAAVELLSALSSSGDNVAHLAHLGGMFFGFLLIRYWHHRSKNIMNSSNRLFDFLRTNWENNQDHRTHMRPRKTTRQPDNSTTSRPTMTSDMDYNRQQKEIREQIDRILDKIRQSGYDSLTAQEKQTLFDHSRRS